MEPSKTFLDFIYLSKKVNNAPVLAFKIRKSLKTYGLNFNDILSCSTDNCRLKNKTFLELQIWFSSLASVNYLLILMHDFFRGLHTPLQASSRASAANPSQDFSKNYVPIKSCIISKNRIDKNNKNCFLSKSEK